MGRLARPAPVTGAIFALLREVQRLAEQDEPPSLERSAAEAIAARRHAERNPNDAVAALERHAAVVVLELERAHAQIGRHNRAT